MSPYSYILKIINKNTILSLIIIINHTNKALVALERVYNN